MELCRRRLGRRRRRRRREAIKRHRKKEGGEKKPRFPFIFLLSLWPNIENILQTLCTQKYVQKENVHYLPLMSPVHKVLSKNAPKVLKNTPDRSMRLFLTPTAAHTIHNSNWKYICQMLLHATRRGGERRRLRRGFLWNKWFLITPFGVSIRLSEEGEKHILLRFLAP